MISRRIIAALALLCAVIAPAQAQKTKAQLNTEIGVQFQDNTAGAITPLNLRTVTGDIVNAIMPTAPVTAGNLACFNGTTGLLQECATGASTNDVLSYNGTSWIHTGLISLLNTLCTASPGTCATFFGYYNVIWYGADPLGVASSTTAINNAVAAACAPGVKGIVWGPPGTYLVNGGVNATSISAGCTIKGAGLTATILKVTTATNAILDMTGSSAVAVEGLQLTDNGTNLANFGILLSTTTAPSPCNVNHFKAISITGRWIKAGLYIYDCSDSSFENSQISNFNSTASACVYISNTNDLTATSSYSTITAVTGQSGDWRFSSFEIHDLSQVAGTSTVYPLFIGGVSSPIKFIGGVIAGSVAAATGGNVTFAGVPTTSVSFIGTQFYADNGTPSKFAFWTFNNMTGLVVQGSSIQYGTSFLSQANGAIWDALSITGNTFSGGSFVTPTTAATITRSLFDARALAINLGAGGTLTHSVMLQPGTITAGTQTANGSF